MEEKVETTVVISKKVLSEIDYFAKNYRNRSECVEKALEEFIERHHQLNKKVLSEEEEIAILNKIAEEQEEEILETLEYQIDW